MRRRAPGTGALFLGEPAGPGTGHPGAMTAERPSLRAGRVPTRTTLTTLGCEEHVSFRPTLSEQNSQQR